MPIKGFRQSGAAEWFELALGIALANISGACRSPFGAGTGNVPGQMGSFCIFQ
jgi:hypothetical protein